MQREGASVPESVSLAEVGGGSGVTYPFCCQSPRFFVPVPASCRLPGTLLQMSLGLWSPGMGCKAVVRAQGCRTGLEGCAELLQAGCHLPAPRLE